MGCMCEGADEHAPMGTFSSAWSWAAQRKSTAPLQRQPAFVFWMASGGETKTEVEVTAELIGSLVSKTHGKFAGYPQQTAPMIAEYVVTVLKVTEYEEIMCMGREVFIDVMDECMGGVPKPLKTMTMCWYLEGLKLPAGKASNVSSKVDASVKANRKKPTAELEADEDEDGPVLESNADAVNKAAMAMKDSLVMKMSKDSITAMDRTLHSGQIVHAAECEGAPYACDTAYSDYARKLTKLEVETLPKILRAKDVAKYDAHITSVVRQYNEAGKTAEVTNITTFNTTTNDIFEGDGAGKLAYVAAYRQKYKGRAFVKEVDIVLVLKHRNSPTLSLAGIKEEIKMVKEQLKASSNGLASADELTRLSTRVGQIQGRVNVLENNGGSTRSGGGGDDKKCSYCKQSGHFIRDCPKKVEDDAAKKANAEAKEE